MEFKDYMKKWWMALLGKAHDDEGYLQMLADIFMVADDSTFDMDQAYRDLVAIDDMSLVYEEVFSHDLVGGMARKCFLFELFDLVLSDSKFGRYAFYKQALGDLVNEASPFQRLDGVDGYFHTYMVMPMAGSIGKEMFINRYSMYRDSIDCYYTSVEGSGLLYALGHEVLYASILVSMRDCLRDKLFPDMENEYMQYV